MELEQEKRQLSEHGWCVVPGVLTPDETAEVRRRLWAAAEKSEALGAPTRNIGLDPNEHNVRVFGLLELDAIFRDLIQHPVAIDLVTYLLGDGFLISNFTANIALPGSQSMELHSDQSIVIPEPWLEPWAINIIWCLNDVRDENGATLYLPGSHKITRAEELPENPEEKMKPFEAPAGSILAMEGRMWHTSGRNRTKDEERALLFGYYSRDFIRPQTNWNVVLSPETIAGLSDQMKIWLGLEQSANVRLAERLVKYGEAAAAI